ncbi:hypothetical protein REPUB_Repub06bG0071600 [Reevesia pubescens]
MTKRIIRLQGVLLNPLKSCSAISPSSDCLTSRGKVTVSLTLWLNTRDLSKVFKSGWKRYHVSYLF